MSSIELEIASRDHLADKVDCLVSSHNVRRGPLMPASEREDDCAQFDSGAIPFECVFVYANGGVPAAPCLGFDPITCTQRHAEFPILTVRVRSRKNQYTRGLELAHRVFAALNFNPPIGYYEAVALTGGPLPIGKDDLGSYVWTFDVRLSRFISIP